MNEYAEVCAERDRLKVEVKEAHMDCIRLQQEINCLRMEPCQLPACEKNQRDIEKMKLSQPTSEWIKDRDAWKAKADELARDLAVAKLEILGLRGGAEFFKAKAKKLVLVLISIRDNMRDISVFRECQEALSEYDKECK